MMKWQKITNNNVNNGEAALCTNENGQYVVGLIFDDPDSETGFICCSDDTEIQCSYFLPLNNQKWNKIKDCLPNNNEKAICRDALGHTVIGEIRDLWGTFVAYVDGEEALYDVQEWESIPPLVISLNKSKPVNVGYLIGLAAMFLLGIIAESVIGYRAELQNMDFADIPQNSEQKYDAAMYEMVRTKKDEEATAEFMEEDDFMASVNQIQIILGSKIFMENFQADRFYVDEKENWHYVTADDAHIIATLDGLYIINSDFDKYSTYDKYFINFIQETPPLTSAKNAVEKDFSAA